MPPSPLPRQDEGWRRHTPSPQYTTLRAGFRPIRRPLYGRARRVSGARLGARVQIVRAAAASMKSVTNGAAKSSLIVRPAAPQRLINRAARDAAPRRCLRARTFALRRTSGNLAAAILIPGFPSSADPKKAFARVRPDLRQSIPSSVAKSTKRSNA